MAHNVMENLEIEDPILCKLRAAIDGYRARVAAWEQAIRPLATQQSVPSSTTLGLFGLSSILCIAVNAFALNSSTPTQEIALSNLGCTALFGIAAISLFYDRVVRGYGKETILRRSAENASEITVQLQALAEIQVDVQYRVQRLSRDLNALSISIENQNDVAEDLKAKNLIAQKQRKEYEETLAGLRAEIMSEASRLNRLQFSVNRLEEERKELEQSIQAHTDSLFEVAARREDVSADLMVMESTRDSMRAAWAVEQEERRVAAAKMQDQIRTLYDQKNGLREKIETVEADMIHLQHLRSEMQAEIELIGEEQERRTAASIEAIYQLQARIEELQQGYDQSRLEFGQLQQAIRNAQLERDSILDRIARCDEARIELEDAVFESLGQIHENQETLETVRTAITAEENKLSDRRMLAEREAIEADSRQEERIRVLQELERRIETAVHERDALDSEIDRLSGVKGAMDVSIDELTNRLEHRAAELRRKNNQLQEQADRLERLSEAIQKLTIRESEMRQTADESLKEIAPQATVGSLPSPIGQMRSIHSPHFSIPPRTNPISQGTSDELIEG
jgi:chromosome segregation ATPase